jgi:truncated hemoglobin YjbI
MKAGHKGLGITTAAFDTIVKHLGNTLKDMGVPADVIAEAAAVANTTKADIVEVK